MQSSYPSLSATPPPPRPTIPRYGAGNTRFPFVARFFGYILWYWIARTLAVSASSGFALRFDLVDAQPLLEALALLFLVVLGISALNSRDRASTPLRVRLGLPWRVTARDEWGLGAALGWGLATLSVLAMLLGSAIHIQVWTAPHAFLLLVIDASALAIATLAKVLALYGYGFQQLMQGIGAPRAIMLSIAFVTIDAWLTPGTFVRQNGSWMLVSALGALLLCLCWIRTHAVWLGWGAWFGWSASTALVFGLPLEANSTYSALVDARSIGPNWLTGGDYGPSSAGLTALFLVLAIPVLIRLTSDYAWEYTRSPILPAGIPVEVPPPAAHAAVEAIAAQPSLVQIQPTGSVSSPPDTASE